jgi:YbbR domain-containing protein
MNRFNILILALSLIISIVLWSIVSFYVNPEGETVFDGIPVRFINESSLASSDLMLTGGEGITVDVRFTGRLRDLAGLNKSTLRADVDLRNVRTTGDILMSFDIRGEGVNFLSVYPLQDTVTVTIDRRVSKYVDIHLDFAGEVAENFILDPAVFYPAHLEITGPSKEIDSVSRAVVRYEPPEPLSRSVTDIPVSYDLVLDDGEILENGRITADHPDVRLTIPVVMVKTVPLVVDLIEGGGLTRENTDTDIQPGSVRIAGDPDVLALLNFIQIQQINLAPLQNDLNETFVIHYPEGVRNFDFIDEARVTLSINVPTREIGTTNITIHALELPDGYTHAVITSPVMVTLRGPAADLERVEPNNVRVVVDFSDANIASAGRLRRTALVFVDGFDTVGAVELGYEVTIEIEPLNRDIS